MMVRIHKHSSVVVWLIQLQSMTPALKIPITMILPPLQFQQIELSAQLDKLDVNQLDLPGAQQLGKRELDINLTVAPAALQQSAFHNATNTWHWSTDTTIISFTFSMPTQARNSTKRRVTETSFTTCASLNKKAQPSLQQ